jgi:hypothetical protein
MTPSILFKYLPAALSITALTYHKKKLFKRYLLVFRQAVHYKKKKAYIFDQKSNMFKITSIFAGLLQ